MSYYQLLLFAGAIVALLLAGVAWQRRRAHGARPLIAVQLSTAWWLLCGVVPLPHMAPDEALFLRGRLAFLGIACLPVATLLFALGYTSTVTRVRRGAMLALAVEPVLVLVAVATPALHDSFFGSWRGQVQEGVQPDGPLFVAHTLYSYVLLLASLGVMIRYYRGAAALGRRQTRYILVAFLFPVLCNTFYVAGISPHDIDLTPLGLVASAGLVSLAIFHRGFLDLVAGAHEKITGVITDGIVVLDQRQRIVDSNPALWHIVNRRAPDGHGQFLADIIPELHVHLAELDNQPATIEFANNGGQYLELRVFALLEDDGDERIGQILILRDISLAKATELALHGANEQLRTQLATIEAMQHTLREQALRDPLTGLYNRRYLAESMQRELAGSRRSGAPFAVVLIDIDHFKSVNDTYGHASGDAVLRALGTLLAQRSRATDTPCRFGGEEFCVILQADSIATAARRVDQWREEFAALTLRFDGIALAATFSAGMALHPEHGADEASLLAAADKALYAAKAAGRNRVCACIAPHAPRQERVTGPAPAADCSPGNSMA